MTNSKCLPSQPATVSPSSTMVTMVKPGGAAANSDGQNSVERIGDTLRRIREQRGDDLQQIADYLCIRRNYLEAIEQSHYDTFPADAYVIGFLRSYANLLGLDGRQAIERYRREMAGRRRKPALSMPTPMTEGRTPSAVIMIGATIAAFLLYMTWYGLSSSDRASISRPPALPTTAVTADAQVASTAAAPTTVAVAPLPPTAVVQSAPSLPQTQDTPRLTIRADQASWILITDSMGHTLYDHVLKAGEIYHVPDMEGLNLTSGNSSGLILTLNGVDLPRISNDVGHVVKNMSLDTAALKAKLDANPGTSE